MHETTGNGISPRQRRFLQALMQSPSIKDAAKAAGIGERTCYKYLNDPSVKAALTRLHDDTMAQAARETAAAMSEALRVLRDIATDPEQPAGARVSAARAIRDSGVSLNEQQLLTERVAELEAQINGRKS